MTMHRMVNGQVVEIPPEEEEQILAEWAANAAAVREKQQAEQDEASRSASLRADAMAVDLLDKLTKATPEEIASYVDTNVTDLASARAMFKRVLLVMALIAK